MPRRILAVALALLVVIPGYAQDRVRSVRLVDEPRTKLEHFGVRTGSVVVTLSAAAGTLNAAFETAVYVETRAMTDTRTREKQGGICIRLVPVGGPSGEDNALIDAEEIEQLLKAIDYIMAIEKGITKLAAFRADFRTVGDFGLSAYTAPDGQLAVSLSTGRLGIGGVPGATAQLDFRELPNLRKVVASAQATLRTLPSP